VISGFGIVEYANYNGNFLEDFEKCGNFKLAMAMLKIEKLNF